MNTSKYISLVLAIVILLCTAGCAAGTPAASETPAAPETVTITDHLGNTVEIPANIERIAICGIYPLASALTVFFGSAEKIVAMPKASLAAAKSGLLGELYPEILSVETECVSGDTVNTEELMKLRPDVVFYSDTDTATGEMLKNAGFSAVALSVTKWDFDAIETLSNWLELLGTMFPSSDRAAAFREYADGVYDLVRERVSDIPEEDRVNAFILFQYTDSVMMTSGGKHFGEWWCTASGAKNAASELQGGTAAVSMEQVYAWNPDVILVSNFTTAQPEDILGSTIGSYDWSGVCAVEAGRVYKMPLGLYRTYTPGADAPVALLWMAKTFYPDRFEDIDIIAETKAYYEGVFGVSLTDEQAAKIFAPESDAANGVN